MPDFKNLKDKSLLDKLDETITPDVLKLARNKLKSKTGEFLSNVKMPYGYDLPGMKTDMPMGIKVQNEKGEQTVPDILEKGLKIGQGVNDVFNAGINTVIGNDKPIYNIPKNKLDGTAARHYLLRKEMGMDDESSNILGGKDTFIKAGDNIYRFNPANEFGKKNINMIDALAKDWNDWKTEHTKYDPEAPEYRDKDNNIVPQTQYPYALSNTVLGNIGFEQKGEGEDENGYYVKVGGKDVWDFGLHDNESIFDNIPVNLLRTILDRNIIPQQVDYDTKVYMKDIKKQPRKKEVKKGLVFSAD